jgi:2-keto-3-deoxy-L-rhamnonate aldolase RhmA
MFGTWVKLPALETVELLAHAGFDYIVVDLEHSPLTTESAYRASVVAQAMGVGALVRVPQAAVADAQRLLDAGVDGILVPQVADRAAASAAVGPMLFEPRGTRGMGLTSRAGRWGLDSVAAYLQRGNENQLRVVQLEDMAALADCDQIVGVDGVDGVFIGLGDLSLSSGRPADDAEIQALLDRVLTSCAEAGLPCGTAVGDADAAKRYAARGFDFVMVSNDTSLFARAAADLGAALRP